METPTMASSARATSYYDPSQDFRLGELTGAANHAMAKTVRHPIMLAQMQVEEIEMVQRRVVQVLIADTNQNVPLEQCLLFKGEEKLTDATDQELFFEIGIKELLDTHNANRIKIVDKTIKDRTEYLEPAKVRDLKMVVVTVANL